MNSDGTRGDRRMEDRRMEDRRMSGGPTSGDPTNGEPRTGDPTSDGPTSDGPTSDGPTSDGRAGGRMRVAADPAGGAEEEDSANPSTGESVAALTARLSRLYTGAVHDVLRALGHDNCVLPVNIRPLDPGLKVAGPAWTFSGRMDRTASRHDTLLGWTRVLSKAPPGHVLVCQPNNQEVALMGELSAETLKNKGVLGYVVDGGCRDTDFILQQQFPVFHTFFTPSDIAQRWVADRLSEPLTIGSVTIRTGDFILGDRDGVIVIAREIAQSAIEQTEQVALTENQVRGAIRAGVDPVDAFLEYGKF